MAIEPVKIILCAHSGSGKTGANASLAEMGLRIRYLDLDNGVDILRNLLRDKASAYVKRNPKASEFLESVVPIQEQRKSADGKLTLAKAEVWPKVSRQIEKWVDPTTGHDYGSIGDWTT